MQSRGCGDGSFKSTRYANIFKVPSDTYLSIKGSLNDLSWNSKRSRLSCVTSDFMSPIPGTLRFIFSSIFWKISGFCSLIVLATFCRLSPFLFRCSQSALISLLPRAASIWKSETCQPSISLRNSLAAVKRENCPRPFRARMSGAPKFCSSRLNSVSGFEKSASLEIA